MSRSVERRVKLQHAQAAEWLDNLSTQKVRALAFQHRLNDPMHANVETLKTQLLLLKEVRDLAGVMDGKEESVQKKE
jgi:hypothetical protein